MKQYLISEELRDGWLKGEMGWQDFETELKNLPEAQFLDLSNVDKNYIDMGTARERVFYWESDLETAIVHDVSALVEALEKTTGFIRTWSDCLAGVQMSKESFVKDCGLREATSALSAYRGK